jgi:3-methyladenine DNA glycosylase/8-oxoguanine DNA glycosylase
MQRSIHIKVPQDFSFRATVLSHGWSDLPPFETDQAGSTLRFVFYDVDGPVKIEVISSGSELCVDLADKVIEIARLKKEIGRMFCLEDSLGEFYEMTRNDPRLSWVAEKKVGRLLRSPTVFEDVVKTICTTNCSWGLTKKMVSNLVEKLGQETKDGSRAFPTPESMAAVSEDFYREEIRAGYRSPYLSAFARRAVAGDFEIETWPTIQIETAQLKKEIKSIKGIGDYGAETLLKLLGRFDGLALDSWLRAQYYKRHNLGRACDDKKIERHYRKYGKWRGLAIWCDMTEEWFAEK